MLQRRMRWFFPLKFEKVLADNGPSLIMRRKARYFSSLTIISQEFYLPFTIYSYWNWQRCSLESILFLYTSMNSFHKIKSYFPRVTPFYHNKTDKRKYPPFNFFPVSKNFPFHITKCIFLRIFLHKFISSTETLKKLIWRPPHRSMQNILLFSKK